MVGTFPAFPSLQFFHYQTSSLQRSLNHFRQGMPAVHSRNTALHFSSPNADRPCAMWEKIKTIFHSSVMVQFLVYPFLWKAYGAVGIQRSKQRELRERAALNIHRERFWASLEIKFQAMNERFANKMLKFSFLTNNQFGRKYSAK